MSVAPRTLPADEITDAIATMCVEANRLAPAEMRAAMEAALATEASPMGRDVLHLLLENYATAADSGLPICQDTGLAVVMVMIWLVVWL